MTPRNQVLKRTSNAVSCCPPSCAKEANRPGNRITESYTKDLLEKEELEFVPSLREDQCSKKVPEIHTDINRQMIEAKTNDFTREKSRLNSLSIYDDNATFHTKENYI